MSVRAEFHPEIWFPDDEDMEADLRRIEAEPSVPERTGLDLEGVQLARLVGPARFELATP